MSEEQGTLGELEPAIPHFLKVTQSYWPGLFHCYEIPGLPATNNELEQTFGTARHHERRVSGRKSAAPGTVVRGAVRIVAAVVAKVMRFDAADLRPRNPEALATLRAELARRAQARTSQRRFRRDPDAYLQLAEDRLIRATLPA